MRVLDLVIVFLYLVISLYVGYKVRSRADTAQAFVAAKKSLPFPVVMATLFATLMGAGLTLGWAGKAMTVGATLIGASIGGALCVPVFTWLAPRFRRSGLITVPEMMGSRYGMPARCLTSVMVAIYSLLLLGLQFMAFGRLFGYIGAPLGITPAVGSVIGCGIAIIYTALAGMFGVAYTDVLQFILMVASVIVVIPLFGVHFAGGLSAIEAFALERGTSIFNPFYGQPIMAFISLATILFITMFVEPPSWQRMAAAKSLKDLKFGFYAYMPLAIIYGYAVVWAGMSGAILFPHIKELYGTTEAVLPALVLHYMPPVVAGLMLAALLGVIMSTVDSYLLISSSSVVYDLAKYLRPDTPDAALLRVLKYATFAIGVLALIASFFFKGLWDMLIFAFTLYPAALAPALAACFFWRKATGTGAVCSIVASAMATIASYSGWIKLGMDPIFSSTGIGLITLVAVSYLTYDPRKETRLIGEVAVESEPE